MYFSKNYSYKITSVKNLFLCYIKLHKKKNYLLKSNLNKIQGITVLFFLFAANYLDRFSKETKAK